MLKVDKNIFRRKVMFEKTPIRVKVKEDTKCERWWCNDYRGKTITVTEVNPEIISEEQIVNSYNIKEYKIDELYLFIDKEGINAVAPKIFFTTKI